MLGRLSTRRRTCDVLAATTTPTAGSSVDPAVRVMVVKGVMSAN
jgi:hypothetical protein